MARKSIAQAREEIQAVTEFFQDFPEIYGTLTPLELEVLLTLLKHNYPLSTKEIRQALITEKYDRFFKRPAQVRSPSPEEEELINKVKKLWEGWRSGKITKTEYFQALEKDLRERGISIPSFERIENILLSLESLGLVSKRVDERKKAKCLWLIVPKYRVSYNKKREEFMEKILDLKKKYPDKDFMKAFIAFLDEGYFSFYNLENFADLILHEKK
ncbi:MAG: hypothetical protein J7L44_00145 [Candidatus Diapherotrites archaeon]|nr:hypothetical protein [Candidatus Diapherotrites archaeon]